MKRAVLVTAIFAAAAGWLAAGHLQPAEAHVGWGVGGGFRVGPLDFSLVLGHPGLFPYRGHGPAPPIFYRTRGPLHYPGFRCGSACYRGGGFFYHHTDCPLVLQHFRRHRHAPPHIGYRGYGDRGFGHHYGRPGYPGYGYRGFGLHYDRPGYPGHGYRGPIGREGRSFRRHDGRGYRRYDSRHDGPYRYRRDRRHGRHSRSHP